MAGFVYALISLSAKMWMETLVSIVGSGDVRFVSSEVTTQISHGRCDHRGRICRILVASIQTVQLHAQLRSCVADVWQC